MQEHGKMHDARCETQAKLIKQRGNHQRDKLTDKQLSKEERNQQIHTKTHTQQIHEKHSKQQEAYTETQTGEQVRTIANKVKKHTTMLS